MVTLFASVHDIPSTGRHMIVEDPAIWNEPMKEFHVECQIVTPIRAEITLLPVQGGCLVRGKLTGHVVQNCDLCAEDAPTIIDHEIDTFEAIPGESIPFDNEEDENNDDFANALMDSETRIIVENSAPKLDVALLCWEEFMLSLPMRPVCKENCQGLCPTCGINLNENSCACTQDEGDPRLAALRTLKITKSK